MGRFQQVSTGIYSRNGKFYARTVTRGKRGWKVLEAGSLKGAQQEIKSLVQNKGPLVSDFALDWVSKYTPNKSKRAKQNSLDRINCHLIPCLGKVPLTLLSLKDILDYRAYLESQGLAVQTVHSYLSDLRVMLNCAVDLKMLDSTPFISKKVMPRLPQKNPRDTMLTQSDIDKILEVALPEHRAAIGLAVYTGCRWGELRLAKWSHVSEINGYPILQLGKTKSGKKRIVPLNPKAKELLNWILNEWGLTEYILPQRPNFPTHFSRYASEKSGITFKFKDLRDTFACTWLDSGGSLEALQKLLGHASVRTTESHYGQLGQSALINEVVRVNGKGRE